jgi:malate synthase
MNNEQRTTLLVRHGIEILGPIEKGYEQVLTVDALVFVAELHKRFDARRRALLAARDERQSRIDAGEMPDFLHETRHIREVQPPTPLPIFGCSAFDYLNIKSKQKS